MPNGLPALGLVIQDELHLIEGPLGSMVWLLQTARSSDEGGKRQHAPKYIASTATIRAAEGRDRCLLGTCAYFLQKGQHGKTEGLFVKLMTSPRATERNPAAFMLESVQ